MDDYDEPFWTIAWEMAQLNDYCVLSLQETSRKLKEMQQELKELESGTRRVTVEDSFFGSGDFTGETITSLHEEIPVWEDT